MFGKHINKKLQEISQKEKEKFEEHKIKGEEKGKEIFEFLQKHSSFVLPRHIVINSIGRRCSKVKCPELTDFDLIIFISHQTPPFTDIIADFEDILLNKWKKTEKILYVNRTLYSDQFQVIPLDSRKKREKETDTYLSFTISPAMNILSPAQEALCKEEREILQIQEILKLIAKFRDPRTSTGEASFYNSSLIEGYASFIESQSEFVHQMIRLAKLWNQKVYFKKERSNYYYIHRPFVIELIAISCARNEQDDAKDGKREESILLAFQMFLKKLVFDFDKSVHEIVKYPRMDKVNLELPYETYTDMTCGIEGPLILNPVNPFHNFARDLRYDIKIALKSHARHTLKAIHYYKGGDHLETYFGI